MLIERELQEADFEKLLLQSKIEVQEAILTTLAKELHDNIGQLPKSSLVLVSSCPILSCSSLANVVRIAS